MRKFKIILTILLILSLSSLQFTSIFASAGDKIDLDSNEDNQELEVSTNVGMLFVRYLFSVIGILILTYLGVKLFARSQQNANPAYGDWIQIIDQMPLGNNKNICLIEIEGKGYVLGITDQQINIITTIEEEKRLNELRGLSIQKETGKMIDFSFLKPKKKQTNFQNTLQDYIKQTQELYNNQQKGDGNYEE